MTIRRDVEAMPERFAYFGGHIVPAAGRLGPSVYQIEREADSFAEAKASACRRAISLIRPDMTLFIDCGTTLVHLAHMLPRDMSLTVVCYSLNVAAQLAARPDVRMVLLGGLYYSGSASFSADGGEPLSKFGIDLAFLSAGGVDRERGASCAHLHEVPVKQKAIENARESFLVIDSSKIGRVRPMYFARASAFRRVITELGDLDLQAAEWRTPSASR
ncbi:DeoR/GlpR family DNA-binding transcription regulator [Phenylobacterium sp. LH3H17]|nr:DeoR/GlpR family DNA-binding transcription regulator [Phenylobacterium sp. LH3H17]